MRFSVKPSPDAAIVYCGTMAVHRTLLGWIFAQASRMFGRPIVANGGENVPVDVSLRSLRDGGVLWTRLYHFAEREPIAAASIKRFSACDGLIEYSTRGLGMRLSVTEEGGSLHFRSVGHFVEFGRVRLPLPNGMTPGDLHVEHRDEGGGRFRFRLTVRHPIFGLTFLQDGIFQEKES
jgi:hypothetical protein